jgi:hypothetical protein
MNRIGPKMFMDCFSSWGAECWPDELDLVAIDGKTSRRTHNQRTGHKALHLVSAFATNSRLVLGQEAVFEKSNEITAIPALIARLDLKGALVSTDAMGCQTAIAQSTLDAGADYLLAATSRRSTPRSKAISQPRRQPKSRRSRPSTRTTAVSRFAITASPIRLIGMRPSAPIRAPRVFRSSPPSRWSKRREAQKPR